MRAVSYVVARASELLVELLRRDVGAAPMGEGVAVGVVRVGGAPRRAHAADAVGDAAALVRAGLLAAIGAALSDDVVDRLLE